MTELAPPHLILLPGMGADDRLLIRQREAFPDLIVPQWIAPERRESLAHYAERMAATVHTDRPCVIGGVSLGGMVAAEMARHIRSKSGDEARMIVLVSSCTNPGPVNPLLRLSELLARPVPNRVLSWSLFGAPLVIGKGYAFAPQDRRLLLQMVRETPMPFLRWAGRAILEWPGLRDSAIPIRSIHGSRDWVISPRKVRADVMIENGPHVLNVSHPREVNAFLRDALAAAA